MASVAAQAPDETAAEVSKKIDALEARVVGAAIHLATRNCAVRDLLIFRDWQSQAVLVTSRGTALTAFHDGPAIVFATARPGRLEIDFLQIILAHVRDIEVASLTIEADAPGVAQAKRPDLVQHGVLLRKRIVRRDGVGPVTGVHVDADELTEQRGPKLSVSLWIEGPAAIPEAQVQHSVGTETQSPAIVIGERL